MRETPGLALVKQLVAESNWNEVPTMRNFETGATRDSDTNKYDYEGFLAPSVLEAYAAYMHKNRVQADGNLRDSDNWQKGIPLDAYMKSMFRHFMSVWKGHRSGSVNEEELCALMFNVMGYLFETLKDRDAETHYEEFREHFSSPEPPTEGELVYEDYAPGYHTSLSTLPGMERSEVLGICPQRSASEVDALAPEVRSAGFSEACLYRPE